MMDDYSPEPKWYVAHTYSGYENKVMDDIRKIVGILLAGLDKRCREQLDIRLTVTAKARNHLASR